MPSHPDRVRRNYTEEEPFIYPCGCSRFKVRAGLCSSFAPNGILRPTEPICICGADDSPNGVRMDVVCPKHDGEFRA